MERLYCFRGILASFFYSSQVTHFLPPYGGFMPSMFRALFHRGPLGICALFLLYPVLPAFILAAPNFGNTV
jgi:hypothetical protein